MQHSVQQNPTPEQILAMYRVMLLIRRTEEQVRDDFHAGNLPGGVHLYIGQEAIAAGVCVHLNDADWITSTHRGHGHYLAKGGDPEAMLAEIQAREGGICKGMGGSMHVADYSRGIIGANGIVGGGLGISAGAAFAAKLDGNGAVAVCFFGDGAANQGVFMETLNVATLWKLPLVLVCEHNGYSEFSPSDTVTAGEIVDRARAFNIPADVVDGNDAVAVWQKAEAAVERARNGGGPSFIEAKTYRIYGHNESEVHWLSGKYRDEDEIEPWRKRDPIQRLSSLMLEQQVCTDAELAALDAEVTAQVAAAAEGAVVSGPPDPALINDMMFAGQQP
ncbi:MAG: thiamine pyrophosphate-dependent dehydrogenase E1 component subunit alpha [Gammaproteobacteria bacterium]|nr:thiamine pyrophosphate-dependent dehydrogenase E1 component subunit alpha [Gammaproteobacteria bacterium]